jgi:hypothetical protein
MSQPDAEAVLRAIRDRHPTPPPDTHSQLRADWAQLCQTTAEFLDEVVSLPEQATPPAPGSRLDREIASLPVRNRAGRQIRVIQTAIVPAAMSLNVAADSLRAVAAALPAVETVLPLEVLARHILECASTAIWLVDPSIGGRARVARMLLLRYESGAQEVRAAKAVGSSPGGPTPEQVAAIASDWNWHLQKNAKGRSLTIEGQTLPVHTERANEVLRRIQAAGAYNLYSGSAHAEMYGLWRALSPPMDAAGETYNIMHFDYIAAWHAVRVANLSALTAALDYRDLKGRNTSEVQQMIGTCETALALLHPAVAPAPPDDDFHEV